MHFVAIRGALLRVSIHNTYVGKHDSRKPYRISYDVVQSATGSPCQDGTRRHPHTSEGTERIL